MSIIQNNLQQLQQVNPALAAEVTGTREDANVSLQQTRSGTPTLIVHKADGAYALHHPENPIKHSTEFLSSIQELPKAQNITFLGCGLFYLPHLLLKQRPLPRRLFLLEPSLSVFRKTMQTVDISELIQNPAVTIIVNSERGSIYNAMMPYLMDIMANSLLLIDVPPSTAAFPEWTKTAKQKIRELLQFGQSGLVTKFKDGPRCLNNLLQNMDFIGNSPGLKNLGDLFNDVPAIIVAAGPSLEKNIDEIEFVSINECSLVKKSRLYEFLEKNR